VRTRRLWQPSYINSTGGPFRRSSQSRTASCGKHALNAQSRALAYAVKSQRISTALEHFEEFFKVSLAERNPRHGILILVHLPDGRGAHIPLASLTAAAQARLCGLVMAMIDPPSVQADESGARSHRFKDAA